MIVLPSNYNNRFLIRPETYFVHMFSILCEKQILNISTRFVLQFNWAHDKNDDADKKISITCKVSNFAGNVLKKHEKKYKISLLLLLSIFRSIIYKTMRRSCTSCSTFQVNWTRRLGYSVFQTKIKFYFNNSIIQWNHISAQDEDNLNYEGIKTS